jgi:hypothetical protein
MVSNEYSADALLGFLNHAADKGLMPAATAQALAVGCRNVFQILDDAEKADLRALDLDDVIKRFGNRRAHDFSPDSLRTYGNRLKRAVELFVQWRDDPAGFSVKTRATKNSAKSRRMDTAQLEKMESAPVAANPVASAPAVPGGYSTSFPVRPGVVVTLTNVPADLTAAEAERLAGFVRMLGVQAGE